MRILSFAAAAAARPGCVLYSDIDGESRGERETGWGDPSLNKQYIVVGGCHPEYL